ncbi:hypothetical protein I0C86_15875 [Plantactinospora sp. S1510]|uniref:Uncharacterized protein n=1 Tax=Plantactinospora alkalitolerans TaxID=2789879 RepID=A0ABS0GWH6_9ACTN|nr:hypothetical protein [Plantactinospora alkalitolerans]MBF9130426.1 hypothetical protein [Plantactinospora alkalitolerans]
MTPTLFLYILGTICLALEAVGVRVPRVSFGWIGLTLIAFAALILPEID